MGRPPSDLDEYLDGQERLESYQASGLLLDEFCLREGVSRSSYDRWLDRLKNGIPESMVAEEAARNQAESGEAVFVPIVAAKMGLSPLAPQKGTGPCFRPRSFPRNTISRRKMDQSPTGP